MSFFFHFTYVYIITLKKGKTLICHLFIAEPCVMQVWVVVAVLAGVAGTALGDVPCVNVDSQLTLPCLCKSRSGNITINCDNVAFPGDFPLLPFK